MFQHPFRITVQPGRLGSESVDALARNSRTPSTGMGGRLRRNRHLAHTKSEGPAIVHAPVTPRTGGRSTDRPARPSLQRTQGGPATGMDGLRHANQADGRAQTLTQRKGCRVPDSSDVASSLRRRPHQCRRIPTRTARANFAAPRQAAQHSRLRPRICSRPRLLSSADRFPLCRAAHARGI